MSDFFVKTAFTKDGRQLYFIESEKGNICKEATKLLQDKIRRNRSPNTVRGTAFAVAFYLKFLSEVDMTVIEVLAMDYIEQLQHFEDYLLWLQTGCHSRRNTIPNNNTCNKYLIEVWGFYEFLVNRLEIPGEIKVLECREFNFKGRAGVQAKRQVKVFKGYLSPANPAYRQIDKKDINNLLNACTTLRDKILIKLLEETGFRIGEALGIHYKKDIDFEDNRVKVTFRCNNKNHARAKNAEDRSAKISEELTSDILLYISQNKEILAHSEYLFVVLFGDTKGKPLTINAVYSIFRSLESRTGISATPHLLRHYFANERYRNGWTEEEIQFALGHKSIETTRRYLHIEDKQLAAAEKRYFESREPTYSIEDLI